MPKRKTAKRHRTPEIKKCVGDLTAEDMTVEERMKKTKSNLEIKLENRKRDFYIKKSHNLITKALQYYWPEIKETMDSAKDDIAKMHPELHEMTMGGGFGNSQPSPSILDIVSKVRLDEMYELFNKPREDKNFEAAEKEIAEIESLLEEYNSNPQAYIEKYPTHCTFFKFVTA